MDAITSSMGNLSLCISDAAQAVPLGHACFHAQPWRICPLLFMHCLNCSVQANIYRAANLLPQLCVLAGVAEASCKSTTIGAGSGLAPHKHAMITPQAPDGAQLQLCSLKMKRLRSGLTSRPSASQPARSATCSLVKGQQAALQG